MTTNLLDQPRNLFYWVLTIAIVLVAAILGAIIATTGLITDEIQNWFSPSAGEPLNPFLDPHARPGAFETTSSQHESAEKR